MKFKNTNNKTIEKSNIDKIDDNEFISDPKCIMHSQVFIDDSYTYSKSCHERFDNTFCVFKSIENIYYLIYTNDENDKSIISYNIIEDIKIIEIKNAHKTYITNFRYYFDNTNKRDLILSISNNDSTIKLWNVNNWECLFDIEKIYSSDLYSSCFLNDNNNLYICTSNYIGEVKIYDINGIKIKEIKLNCNYIIINFYDKNLSKNFILSGNEGSVKSYDYKENKIYHIYILIMIALDIII